MLCVRVPDINQPPSQPAPPIPLRPQVCERSPRSVPPSHVAGTQQRRPFTADVQGAEKCLKIFLLIKGALQTCYIHIFSPYFLIYCYISY